MSDHTNNLGDLTKNEARQLMLISEWHFDVGPTLIEGE
jgi:hypothetical protein